MDTFTLLETYVRDRTKDLAAFPDIVQKGIDTVEGEIPFKLKLAITLSELTSFVSHLRKPIELYDGTLVPTNAIVFALSGSGTSKDKSLNAIRRSLEKGYTQIEDQRKEFAKKKAERKALIEGDSATNWQKYYSAPKPLQAGLGTVEGLLDHFADIASNPLGAGSITSTEIGAELQTNGAMTDIIKTVSQLYDLGKISAKIIKSAENQTQAIDGLPVNALLFGAQEALLFNAEIKARFRLVFNTQLARRSIFTYTPEAPKRLNITSVDQLYVQKEKERARVLAAQDAMNNLTEHLVEHTNQEPMPITPDANKLFDVYLEYNALVSDDLPNKYPISKLSRKHKQWLALKLAGVYTILHGRDELDEEMYSYAINTVELLSPDLAAFERELVKEPYEQLADMCKFNAEEGEYWMSLHDLRKSGYITGTGASKGKLEELAKLASSYDETGRYTIDKNGIHYAEIIKTDIVGTSYVIFSDIPEGEEIKSYMGRNCHNGFEFLETGFEDIEDLLKYNAAYGSFKFKDGIRSKANVEGGTKFVILDVDKSCLTDVEAHTLLEEYNHYVVRTSDPDNEFKFRVILELDSVVVVDEFVWKAFLEEIGDHLGLIIDLLPQSQVYFSFENREILKQFKGETLETKDLLEKAALRVADKPKTVLDMPSKEKSLKLADPQTTFMFAYEAEPGERSIKMYRALALAIDLGADKDYLTNLADKINRYWIEPMDAERLNRTLLKPALRRL